MASIVDGLPSRGRSSCRERVRETVRHKHSTGYVTVAESLGVSLHAHAQNDRHDALRCASLNMKQWTLDTVNTRKCVWTSGRAQQPR
jgi:hypothetical protein